MIVFMISVLMVTFCGIYMFVLPVLPVFGSEKRVRRLKYAYIAFVFSVFAVAVPVVYGAYGSPETYDSPLSKRDIFSAEVSLKGMAKVRRLERYLDQNPDDGVIWEKLGHALREAQRYEEASVAFRNAIEYGVKEDIRNWHALAETLIQANNGKILGEAQKALENVLRYRHDDPKAIYFLGLARLQNKDPQKALALWRYLELQLSAQDPWLGVVQQRIKQLGQETNIDIKTVSPKAPTPF